MKEIKYLVTNYIGGGEDPAGSVMRAYLLFTFDGQPDVGLVFNPKRRRDECGSISICRKVEDYPTHGDVWVQIMEGLYKNLGSQRQIERMFGGIKYDLSKT